MLYIYRTLDWYVPGHGSYLIFQYHHSIMDLMFVNPSGDFLPEEIIEQILLKIQCTESIVRCTSVCKLWCCLIRSSKFINTHISRPKNTRYLFCDNIYSYNNDTGVCCGYSLLSDSAPSEECCTVGFPHMLNRIRIHGCDGGVICYSLYNIPHRPRGDIYLWNRWDIYLWNPTVRKLRTLP